MKNRQIIAGAIITMLSAAPVHAKEVPAIDPDRAVKTILGEAEDQGPTGMLAVANTIRNRGTIKGFCGYHAIAEVQGAYVRITNKGTRRIPDRVVLEAKDAWKKSETVSLHSGTHFENVKAFGLPAWAKDMQQVYACGDHVFFKPMSKMSKGV